MSRVRPLLIFCQQRHDLVKTLLKILLFFPFLYIVYQFFFPTEINAFETLVFVSGKWGLWCLFLCLLITPLRRWMALFCRALDKRYGRRLSDWNWLIRCRRMLGIYAFIYASVHMFFYFYLEVDFDLKEAILDMSERLFLPVGVLTWFFLLLLAVTSPKYIMRKMGKYWRRLHRFIYLIGILASAHYIMTGKVGDIEPIIYATLMILLLSERFIFRVFFQNKLPADDGMEAIREDINSS